jgi:antitoxin HicB
MRTYAYRAKIEPGEHPGIVVVSFPDVPEAITEGKGQADALQQAEDALATALLSYPLRRLALPPSRSRVGVKVAVPAEAAAKLAVLEAFAESGLSKSEFARRLGVAETEARRILDPMHPTKLPRLQQALAVLGKRLVVGVEEMRAA